MVDTSRLKGSGTRGQRRRTRQNTTPETQVNPGGVAVQARPVDRTVVPDQDTTLQGLAEGLASASPNFNRFLQAREDAAIAEEIQEAVRRAELEPLQDAIQGETILAEFRTPEAQRMYMKHSGAVRARKLSTELMQDFEENFDPDQDDVDTWLENATNPILEEALKQEDYLEGFLPAFVRAKSQIRIKAAQDQVALVKEDRQNTFQQGLRDVVTSFQKGEDPQAFMDRIEAFREDATVYGLTRQETRAVLIDEVANLAQAGDVEAVEAILDSKMANGFQLSRLDQLNKLRYTAISVRDARERRLDAAADKAMKESANAAFNRIYTIAQTDRSEAIAQLDYLVSQYPDRFKASQVRAMRSFLEEEAEAVEDDASDYSKAIEIADERAKSMTSLEYAQMLDGLELRPSTKRQLIDDFAEKQVEEPGGTVRSFAAYRNLRSDLRQLVPTSETYLSGPIPGAHERIKNMLSEFQSYADTLDPADPDVVKKLRAKADEIGDSYIMSVGPLAKMSRKEAEVIQTESKAIWAQRVKNGELTKKQFNELVELRKGGVI